MSFERWLERNSRVEYDDCPICGEPFDGVTCDYCGYDDSVDARFWDGVDAEYDRIKDED